MKKLIVFVGLLISAFSYSQLNWEWANPIQSSEWTDEFITDVVADNSGNIYVVGETYASTITIGSEEYNLLGERDLFIVKYKNDGEILWSYMFGGTGNEVVKAIAVDNDNSCFYIVGSFGSESIDFQGSVITNEDTDHSKAYIAKLDLNGNLIWIKDFEADGSVSFNDIAVNSTGNVIIVGSFDGVSLSLGPVTLTNTYPSFDNDDVFVAEMDSDGTVAWAKNPESSAGSESSQALEVDNDDNIIIAGGYTYTFTFGETYFADVADGEKEFFVLKLDPDGNDLWAYTGASDGYSAAYRGLATDGTNIFFHFFFECSQVELSGNLIEVSSEGNRESVAVKLNSDGNLEWFNHYPGDQSTAVNSQGFIDMCITNSGEMIHTGSFYGASMLVGDFTLVNPSIISGYATYVVKYNLAGTPVVAEVLGVDYMIGTGAIAPLNENDVAYAGLYLTNSQLDLGEINLSNTGSWDSFIGKISNLAENSTEVIVLSDYSISIYPNPVVSNLKLKGLENSNILRLDMFDFTGRLVSTFSDMDNSCEINMQNIPVGVYLLKIYTVEGCLTKKIIKAGK